MFAFFTLNFIQQGKFTVELSNRK